MIDLSYLLHTTSTELGFSISIQVKLNIKENELERKKEAIYASCNVGRTSISFTKYV